MNAIEAVARALFDCEWSTVPPHAKPAFPDKTNLPGEHSYWMSHARAALKALAAEIDAALPPPPTNGKG